VILWSFQWWVYSGLKEVVNQSQEEALAAELAVERLGRLTAFSKALAQAEVKPDSVVACVPSPRSQQLRVSGGQGGGRCWNRRPQACQLHAVVRPQGAPEVAIRGRPENPWLGGCRGRDAAHDRWRGC
jgi:hypothetical protein